MFSPHSSNFDTSEITCSKPIKIKGRRWRRLASWVALALFFGMAQNNPSLANDNQLSLPRNSDQDYDAPAPGSYALPVVKTAADGEVLGSNGQTLHLRQFTHGRVTVMSFIYTRCASAKACPYATGVLMQLHRLSQDDATLAKHLRLVSLSFDPGADTPKRMADYADLMRGEKAGAQWSFLTTRSQAELRPILDAYGQAVDKKKNPLDPTGPLNHTLRVFLIDGEGRIRNIYSSGTLDPRLVLADVQTLLMEAAASKSKQVAARR